MAKPYVTSIERMGLKKGREEGRQEGRQEGREEGRQVGRQEGLEQGRAEERFSLARRMLEAGYPVEEVQKLTQLSSQELDALRDAPQ